MQVITQCARIVYTKPVEIRMPHIVGAPLAVALMQGGGKPCPCRFSGKCLRGSKEIVPLWQDFPPSLSTMLKPGGVLFLHLMENQGEIILYQPDNEVRLEVRIEDETVWLNRQQLSELFNRDVKTIGKHVNT